MAGNGTGGRPEVVSFNLADLDVSGLDMRLELTTIVPQIPVCPANTCPHNCATHCGCNGLCQCHSHNTCNCNVNACGVNL
jgi:hypothetical protein